jgi:hypothetical protein
MELKLNSLWYYNPWLIEDALELVALTFGVFMRNVETLFDVFHSRKHGTVNQPL